MESQAVGILRREKTILVATMADSLVCFSSKGKRLWHVDMPSPIMCLEDLTIEARGVQFTAVALREGVDPHIDMHTIHMGPFTNDVSREGKGGGYLNSDIVWEVA